MNQIKFEQNDEVMYEGKQWIVVNVDDGWVNLIRQDVLSGQKIRAKAKPEHMSHYVSELEREAFPDDDDDAFQDVPDGIYDPKHSEYGASDLP